jgi:hypothetical protein
MLHTGQQLNADSESRNLCLKSASLYFILLSVPGSSAFSIFHSGLYGKALETFNLTLKLHLVRPHLLIFIRS